MKSNYSIIATILIVLIIFTIYFLSTGRSNLTDDEAIGIAEDYMKKNFPSGEYFNDCRIFDRSDNLGVKCGPEIKEHTFWIDPSSKKVVEWIPGD